MVVIRLWCIVFALFNNYSRCKKLFLNSVDKKKIFFSFFLNYIKKNKPQKREKRIKFYHLQSFQYQYQNKNLLMDMYEISNKLRYVRLHNYYFFNDLIKNQDRKKI